MAGRNHVENGMILTYDSLSSVLRGEGWGEGLKRGGLSLLIRGRGNAARSGSTNRVLQSCSDQIARE